MNKILVICGPTATGKTALGINLAEKFNGEIVSADSRQVYRGMDIITGKDRPAAANNKKQITKIWMQDIVNPHERFNVADYYKLTWKTIEDIWQRGKLPIVVGGTGFYINAVLQGIGTMGIGPDYKLREELSHYSASLLLEILNKLDPKRCRIMNESDSKNPRRLIRAIEVAREIKNPSFASQDQKASAGRQKSKIKDKTKNREYDKLLIGLSALPKDLYERIDRRVEKRIENGAEEEVKTLLKKGYDWDSSVLGTTIGYFQWREYFEKKISFNELIERWKLAEHDYCRRQITWFKKIKEINWFDITKVNLNEKVEKKVESWYAELAQREEKQIKVI